MVSVDDGVELLQKAGLFGAKDMLLSGCVVTTRLGELELHLSDRVAFTAMLMAVKNMAAFRLIAQLRQMLAPC